jgi:uncharacterized protein YkwD
VKNSPRRLSLVTTAFTFLLACSSIVSAQEALQKTVAPGAMTTLEAEVIQEINFARANPGKYAGYLEETRKYYTGKSYLPPSRSKPVTTFDGVAALDEAISFLKTKEALGPLQPSQGLACGARDHAQDMALKGTSGHRGSDGSLPNDRISRYGTWKSTVGEAIVYRVSTAREMVLELIVDDGNPGRPHRNNVFESGFQVAGVSISPQSNHGSFCVITYAGGFEEKAGASATAALAPLKTTKATPATSAIATKATATTAPTTATKASPATTTTPAALKTTRTKSTKRG